MLNDKQRTICEDLGWRVQETAGGSLELNIEAPNGEDFFASLENLGELKEYAANFDPEDHVRELIYAGVTFPGLKALLEDAEWEEDRLWELARALDHAGELTN